MKNIVTLDNGQLQPLEYRFDRDFPADSDLSAVNANAWCNLFVLAKLARTNSDVKKYIESFDGQTGSLDELCLAVNGIIENTHQTECDFIRYVEDGSEEESKGLLLCGLIEPVNGFDNVNTDLSLILKRLMDDKRHTREWVGDLARLCRSGSYMPCPLSTELLKLMLCALPEDSLRHIYLANEECLHVLPLLEKSTREVSIRVRDPQDCVFMIRVLYLLGVMGTVVFEWDTYWHVPSEATSCLALPRFGKFNDNTETADWPVSLPARSLLNADAVDT